MKKQIARIRTMKTQKMVLAGLVLALGLADGAMAEGIAQSHADYEAAAELVREIEKNEKQLDQACFKMIDISPQNLVLEDGKWTKEFRINNVSGATMQNVHLQYEVRTATGTLLAWHKIHIDVLPEGPKYQKETDLDLPQLSAFASANTAGWQQNVLERITCHDVVISPPPVYGSAVETYDQLKDLRQKLDTQKTQRDELLQKIIEVELSHFSLKNTERGEIEVVGHYTLTNNSYFKIKTVTLDHKVTMGQKVRRFEPVLNEVTFDDLGTTKSDEMYLYDEVIAARLITDDLKHQIEIKNIKLDTTTQISAPMQTHRQTPTPKPTTSKTPMPEAEKAVEEAVATEEAVAEVAKETPKPMATTPIADREILFADIKRNDQNYAMIAWMKDQGAIGGYADGKLKAGQEVNRVEFLKMLLVAEEIDTENEKNCEIEAIFSDVAATDWFAPYVCYAYAAGIVGGYPDGTLRPAQGVKYNEAAAMMARANGNPPVDGEVWFYAGFRYLGEQKALDTYIKTSDQALNRRQVIRLIYKINTPNHGEDSRKVEAYVK